MTKTAPPQFKLRLDPGLKEKIERSAEARGVSINAEVNHRLAYSLIAEQANDSLQRRFEAQEQLNAAQQSLIRSLAKYLRDLAEMVQLDKKDGRSDFLRHVRSFAAHVADGDLRGAEPEVEAMVRVAKSLPEFFVVPTEK